MEHACTTRDEGRATTCGDESHAVTAGNWAEASTWTVEYEFNGETIAIFSEDHIVAFADRADAERLAEGFRRKTGGENFYATKKAWIPASIPARLYEPEDVDELIESDISTETVAWVKFLDKARELYEGAIQGRLAP